MKKPRFSLRGLLIFTALLAAFCYWRDRPRQVANAFVAAIEEGNYQAAEAMFAAEKVGIAHKPTGILKWETFRQNQSIADWFRGRCYVNVTGGLANYRYLFPAVATATGMHQVSDWQIAFSHQVPPDWGRQ